MIERRLVRRLLAAALLAVAMGAAAAAQQAEHGGGAAESQGEVRTAPVVVDGRLLFELRGVTSYPAEERAARTRERILELARTAFEPAALRIEHLPLESRVIADGEPVLRLVDADGALEGVERRVLAEVYATRVGEAIASWRAARTREALGASATRILLAAVGAVLLLFGGRRLWIALDRRLEGRLARREGGVTIRSFEVLRADRLRQLLRFVLRVARAVVAILVVYLTLGYLLSQLPWTRGAASQLQAWVMAPLSVFGEGLLEKLPDLVFLLVLFLLVRWSLGLLHVFFAAAGRGEVPLGDFEPEWADPTYKLVRLGVIALALVVAYPYIPGSSTAAFKGISVFLGVIVSLGSSSVVANVIAGYVMIYRRAFREGDVVKIGDVTGVVDRTRLQVTHLRTMKNEEVTIPNASILAQDVVNFSTLARTEGLILHTTVGIGYETPWRQVEAMLLEAASRTAAVLAEPKPFVLELALGDFAVTYELNAYTSQPRGMRRQYAELHRCVLDVFNEYGVQIMTPAYEGDPAEPKIVPRERWHVAPAAVEVEPR